MSKLLWRRPLGIWILCLWCMGQGLPAFMLSFSASGSLRAFIWLFFAAHLFFVVGLLLPLRFARVALAVYLAGNVFATALAGWFLVFVGVAWGLQVTPVAWLIAAYGLFVSWGFMYLFHPDVRAYHEGSGLDTAV